MSTYQPDSWVIVRITSEEHGIVNKVLCSWYGGFARGDSWKLSSGIESCVIENDVYVMPQTSGSVYTCHKNNEHMSSMMFSVLSSFKADAEKSDGKFSIETISMKQLLENLA